MFVIFDFYVLALLISGLVSGWVAWYSFRRPAAPGSKELAVLMLLVSTWSLALIGESLATTYFGKVFWSVLAYPGNQFVPVLFPIFVLRYTQQDRWLTKKWVVALLILPAVSVLMAATNHWHQLLWPSITIENVAGRAVGNYPHGPWFWVEIVYSYTAIALAMAALLRSIFRSPELYSNQTRLILVAALLPLAINVLYAFNPNAVAGIDATSVAFSISGGLLALAFFRYNLFDVTPVARDRLVETIPEGMLVLDAQNRLIDCNPAGQRIFQWERVPIGEAAERLWAGQPDLLALCQMADGDMAELSVGSDGDVRIINFTVTLLHDLARNVAGRILLARDVTTRRMSEAQVYLQAQALNHAANGIVITDTNGLVIWVNPAFTRLTGYTLNEMFGKPTSLLKSGRQAESFYREMWETIAAGKVWHGELINRRKNGTDYYEEMTITPVVQPQGEVSHYIAIKQDVTDRKQAEEELQQAHEMALEANRLKTQLLANVSHDLRTPMGAIMGYADMLRTGVFGEMNERQVEACSEIIDSSNSLLAFLNNLIGQAQLETGKIVLKNRPFSPEEIVETARTTASMMAKKKGLQFTTHVEGNVPETLYGDIYWLRQIITNLLNNAIKFTNHGRVSFRVFRPDATHWALEISDTGIGIPTDAQAAIFEAFRQVDGSITRKYGGSGLGLAIVNELTTLMNGAITLESAPGGGSTFTVTLPMNRPEETQG
ncbi:MAG: histidine kinase N-terminal 7TM domain-containing protein [Chloroflexota bacterium]